MRRFKVVFLLLSCLMLLTVSVPTVSACSGGGFPANLNDMLDTGDLVVTGQFVELDAHRLNGIFRVDRYLVGSGAHYLMLALNNNRTLYRRLIMNRMSSGDCGGDYTFPVSTDADYIFFLTTREDGAVEPVFRPAHSFADTYRPYYEFSADDSDAVKRVVLAYGNSRTDTPPDIREWSRADIVDYILTETASSPVEPDTAQPYPRKAPVLLTLEDTDTAVTSYAMLHVDSPTPVRIDAATRLDRMRDVHQCDAPPCTVFSSTGIDSVQLVPAEGIPPADSPVADHNYTAIGQRVIASPAGDTFAIWQDERLVVYSVMYPSRGFYNVPFGLHEEGSIPVSSDTLDYPAAWSHDGRSLFFSDDSGLYRWHIYTPDVLPQQILSATHDAVPTVRRVSQQGRYLALSEGDNHFVYDTVGQMRLPDGLVAPDDRKMLVFDTTTDTGVQQPLSLQRFVPLADSPLELWPGSHIQWIAPNRYLKVFCIDGYYRDEENDVDEMLCDLSDYNAGAIGTNYGQGIDNITGENISLDYDYRAADGQFVILKNNQRLTFKSLDDRDSETEIDLSAWLSETERIRDVQWMPSLFFDSQSQ